MRKPNLPIAKALLAGLPSAALPLATIITLAACGNDNTAGTDEQANSVTVEATALDSALAVWLEDNTLTIPEKQDTSCTECWYHTGPTDPIWTPEIQARNGMLSHLVTTDFERFSCTSDSHWFGYYVKALDSLIEKYIALPDSMNAADFEADCLAEGGLFTAEPEARDGQSSYTCQVETASLPPDSREYTDPNWKKYVKMIVGVCQSEGGAVQRVSPEEAGVSADDEAYVEGLLDGESISNGIIVDYWCFEEDGPCMWPNRAKMESGTVFGNFTGISNGIVCETELDTASYHIWLKGDTVTKDWHNPWFAANAWGKEAFRDSCEAEGGQITEDSEDLITCKLRIKPLNTDEEYTPPPEGELSMEFLFIYEDPYWRLFATQTIENCRIRPVFAN